MRFVEKPNLPQNDVDLVIIDGRVDKEIEKNLLINDINVIKTFEHVGVYKSISYHPDIMIHHLGKESIVYAPGIDSRFLNILSNFGFELIKGDSDLSCKYPLDIAYNVARVGNFAFHNFKYTDRVLKEELLKRDVELINVNQGYAKCSISIVNDNSIITSDKGIATAAEHRGIEALLISPQMGIKLTGLDYGFIGGCTGLVGNKKWLIAGSFEKLDAKKEIYDFLKRKEIEIISLYNGEIFDIGSIIPILIK